MRKYQIVVIGASDDVDNQVEAYDIGKFIAQRDIVLITGGRGGIMKYASKGACDNDGVVIGILPGDDFSEANEYCTTVIPTGIGFARNIINILSGDIIIAIGGKTGTLSELAYAWQYEKTIICCTFARGWSRNFPESEIDDRKGGRIYSADNVQDVFEIIEKEMKAAGYGNSFE